MRKILGLLAIFFMRTTTSAATTSPSSENPLNSDCLDRIQAAYKAAQLPEPFIRNGEAFAVSGPEATAASSHGRIHVYSPKGMVEVEGLRSTAGQSTYVDGLAILIAGLKPDYVPGAKGNYVISYADSLKPLFEDLAKACEQIDPNLGKKVRSLHVFSGKALDGTSHPKFAQPIR